MTKFFLIRDNLPKILAEKHTPCFYSIAATNEFYNALLQELFISVSNDLISIYNIDSVAQDKAVLSNTIVEIITVLKAIAKSYGIKETDLDSMYYEKLKEEGAYNERYIGFFADQVGAIPTNEKENAHKYQARESVDDPLVPLTPDDIPVNTNAPATPPIDPTVGPSTDATVATSKVKTPKAKK